MIIIQVIADSSLSGGPRHVRDLLEGFKTTHPDWELHLVCPPDGWLSKAAKDLATVHAFPISSGLARGAHRALTQILNEILTSNQPTIVHFQGIRAGIAAGFVLPKLVKQSTATIYTEHRYTKEYHLKNPLREAFQLWALKQALRQMDRVIAVSAAVAAFLTEKHLASPGQLVTIRNGVALPAADLIKHDYSSGQTYQLGAIGSLVAVKGFADLIEAMPLILQNLPHVELDIVGDGPEEARLRGLIRHLRLEKQVRILPTDPDVHRRKLAWDLLLSPSHVESFGMVIAEAMAAGLPVIAARCGATEELITSETGSLVAPHDPHELAKAIIDLLPKKQLREVMGTAARTRITEYFSVKRMVDETAKLYEQTLTSNSAAQS